MRFFEKQRPEVFLHTVKLRRDKKTGRRLWKFTLIHTFNEAAAEGCAPHLAKGWQYVSEDSSGAMELLLAGEVQACTIDFFAQIDDVTPVLHLDRVDLGDFRFTRDGNVIEFWFVGEHENTAGLHAFVKEYAYTRCWAQFSPRQGELATPVADAAKVATDTKFIEACDRMASSVREGGVKSLTISTPGMEPVVIDKAAAERIHERAQEAKKRKT